MTEREKALTLRVAALEGALGRYGVHERDCPMQTSRFNTRIADLHARGNFTLEAAVEQAQRLCDCGLDAALAPAPPAIERKADPSLGACDCCGAERVMVTHAGQGFSWCATCTPAPPAEYLRAPGAESEPQEIAPPAEPATEKEGT